MSRDERRRWIVRKPVERETELVDGVRPDPKGSLAERCAWMKLRQMRKRA